MAADDTALASAIRRQEERLQREPGSLAFAQLADLYRKAGRARDAISLCRDGLLRHPRYATARLILAKALVAEGALAEALAEVRAILELTPGDVPCHRLAAEIHRRSGRIDEAVAHLETVVRLDAGDRESRTLLGLLRATMPTGEAGGLPRVLRDDTFATVAFGTLCLEQGCVEEAAQAFTRVLRRDPDHRQARERLETTLQARQRRKG